MRRRRIALAAGGVFLLVFAGALLSGLIGDDSDRAEAAFLFAPFGVALLLGAALVGPPSPSGVRSPVTGTATVAGETGPARIYRFSRRRQALGVAGSAAFVAMGVGLLVLDEAVLIGLLTVVVFGAFIVLGLLSMAGGATYVALTERGIVQQHAGGRRAVLWEDVAGVDWVDYRGQRFLTLDAGGRVEQGAAGPGALLDRLTPRSFGDLAIGVDHLEHDPEEVEAAVRRCVSDPAARAAIAGA